MLGDSHAKLKRLAANASVRARAYMAGTLSREQDTAAIRAISRDTIWEWGLDTGEIIRTPSWQDTLSIALPVREEFTSWVERIHPEDRTATIKRLQRRDRRGPSGTSIHLQIAGPPWQVSLGLGSRFYRPRRDGLETVASHRPQRREKKLPPLHSGAVMYFRKNLGAIPRPQAGTTCRGARRLKPEVAPAESSVRRRRPVASREEQRPAGTYRLSPANDQGCSSLCPWSFSPSNFKASPMAD